MSVSIYTNISYSDYKEKYRDYYLSDHCWRLKAIQKKTPKINKFKASKFNKRLKIKEKSSLILRISVWALKHAAIYFDIVGWLLSSTITFVRQTGLLPLSTTPILAAFFFQITGFSFYSDSHGWDWMTSRGTVIKWFLHQVRLSFLHSLAQCYCFLSSSSFPFWICMYYLNYLIWISFITSFLLISIRDMSKPHLRLTNQSGYMGNFRFLSFLWINCIGHALPNGQTPLIPTNLWSISSSIFIFYQYSSSLLASQNVRWLLLTLLFLHLQSILVSRAIIL